MMADDTKKVICDKLKQEFIFFKSISNLGVDLGQMLEHMTFFRSLEVKTLCYEGINLDADEFYMVFSGECEVFKTRNEFKVFDEYG
jgi:hypothetical protein